MLDKIRPENYEFLWLVNNQTYFKTSIVFLHKEYMKRDFLAISEKDNTKTYVGKNERKKLSKYGLTFLQKHIDDFKKKAKEQISKANKFFKNIKKKKISSMPNAELKKEFLKTADYARYLWELYFFTEYFLHDEVQKRIEKNPEKNK